MPPESLRPRLARSVARIVAPAAALVALFVLFALTPTGRSFVAGGGSSAGQRGEGATAVPAPAHAAGAAAARTLAPPLAPSPDAARAEYAAARDHFTRIMLLVRNLRNADAGAEMLATAAHLERGLRNAGEPPDPRLAAVLRDARAGAGQLVRDAGAVPVSVGMAVEALGAEVDRAAARLASSPPGRPAVST